VLSLFKKKTDPKEKLRSALGEIELPTFPTVVASALERVRDDEASTPEISDLLSSDPGLSVRLLGTVNSASFALRHRVRNVHHAVSLLGRNQLESLLISMAVRDALPRRSTRGFDVQRFWRTAARRATTARALAGEIEPATRSECFTGGLLQDLAIPLLAHHKGPAYDELLEQWHAGTGELAPLEREAFGWDHAEIAGLVCREWGFPDSLSEAIEGHHSDDPSVPLPAVRLVAPLRESLEESGIDELISRCVEHHGLQAERLTELTATAYQDAEEIARMFA
jgi:HD-like signal output (HDOD) protein